MPATIDEQIAADFQKMGAPISSELVPETDGAFEVGRENWETLRAFLAVETQWRVAATMAGLIWIGMDYAAVDVVLRRFQSPDHVFEELMAMEGEALAVFAEVSREY